MLMPLVITQGGAVKVVDFGIAHVQGDGVTRLTLDGALLGTPAYMAPEQLVGERVDARADIYAAGVVLAEMLTGRHPLSALWFTSRFYPAELRWVRPRVRPWTRSADWLFAVSLVIAGLVIGDDRSAIAVVLLSVGIGAAVAFLVIEPATTRAAFRSSSAKTQ